MNTLSKTRDLVLAAVIAAIIVIMAFVPFLGDITDFKWDYVYSFEPYTSKENIEKAIGFKSDKIKESVNEGTNQVIFTKGKEVVCYIYGYPDDSVYFDFSSLYNYYSISNKYADVLSMDSVKYI